MEKELMEGSIRAVKAACYSFLSTGWLERTFRLRLRNRSESCVAEL